MGRPASAASTTSLRRRTRSSLVPGQARLGEAGRLPGRRREAGVATSAATAARGDDTAVGCRQICDEHPLVVEELCPDRDPHLYGLAVGAVLLAAPAVAAPGRLHPLDATERREIAQRGVGHDDDVTATSAVPAVGPALRHVLLTPEAEAAVAATPRLDVDPCPVVKRHPRSGEGA